MINFIRILTKLEMAAQINFIKNEVNSQIFKFDSQIYAMKKKVSAIDSKIV